MPIEINMLCLLAICKLWVYAGAPSEKAFPPQHHRTAVRADHRRNLVCRLAAFQLFSDGSYRVCVYSGNGGADEVERNYGSFSDFTCIPVIADVEDQDSRQPECFTCFYRMSYLYFARFLLYNSYKKMVYCCGRKKISARSSFFFRGK